MPAIAIIDDRQGDRETIAKVITSTLRKMSESERWAVVSSEPPSKERDVFAWLDENDAPVLVTDWRLNEGSKATRVVTYDASSIIAAIRAKRPNFPIFVITGFEGEARPHLREVENVFSRADFIANVETIVPQMLRAGLRRYEEHRDSISKLDVLAKKIAVGEASDAEKEELKKLQSFLQSEFPLMLDLDAVLTEFERVSRVARLLQRQVELRVKNSKET